MPLLFRTKRKPKGARSHSVAVIDIGSNSIRLVIFAGPRRNPALIFNEKVMAGLGSEISETGALAPEGIDRAITALRRFRTLIEGCNVDRTLCVATAAVRDASDGPQFADRVRDLGFDVDVLSGEEEAQMAAYGVISAIPEANGVVGDLGGGSLELAEVGNRSISDSISLPIGVLRSREISEKGQGPLSKHVAKLVTANGWDGRCRGRTLYIVGGSWRALARVDMYDQGYPLPVFHNYAIPVERIAPLSKRILDSSRDDLRAVPRLATSRIATLGTAAKLLCAACDILKPAQIIVSAYGLREGLIYRTMPEDIRQLDPLLDSTRRFGRYQSRFGQDGGKLFDWIKPAFPDLGSGDKRLLMAACHLADIGWQANPDFRSERALEIALHGNWVGIDAHGRAMLAQALYTNFGGGVEPFSYDGRLCSDADLARAAAWGLAIRLGQRFSGGHDNLFGNSHLLREDNRLKIAIQGNDHSLMGESVERRLAKLASYLEIDYALGQA
ncbi:MAG: Ppx/GppA family phosphatase [Pseudomonadota bacterium]